MKAIQGARRGSKSVDVKGFDAFSAWCQAHGLPAPSREHRFDPDRRWKFDYVFFGGETLVAVECEGGAWNRGRHTRGKGYIADMEKYNAAALQGWTVLRYTPQQLTTPQTLSDLKQALGIDT